MLPLKLNVTFCPDVTVAVVAAPKPGSVSKKYSASVMFATGFDTDACL